MSENPQIYSRAYFQQLHDVEETHWWSRGMRDIADVMIQRWADGRTGLDILDAGCGTGVTLGWLRQYSAPKEVVGIDVSEHALDFCRARGFTSVANESVEDLPFEDDSFDLIVCNDVIQHLVDDRKALREFRRVLRPGGCLNVRTNCKLGIGKDKASASDNYRMYTPEELEEKLTEAGFEVEQLTYVNMLASIKSLAQRARAERDEEDYDDRGLPVRLMPPHLAWLDRALYGILQAESRYLANPGRALPFGSALLFSAINPGGPASKVGAETRLAEAA